MRPPRTVNRAAPPAGGVLSARPVDLWTGPLARASRLSACGAHLWMAGWTTPAGLPTRPPTGRRLPTSSTGPHHHGQRKARQTHSLRSTIADFTPARKGALQPNDQPSSLQSSSRNPAHHLQPVTFPKSPVTFAEIRTKPGCSDLPFFCCSRASAVHAAHLSRADPAPARWVHQSRANP